MTVDVDALWTQMLSGEVAKPQEQEPDTMDVEKEDAAVAAKPAPVDPAEGDAMIRIKRTYNFAGQVHTEEKLVHRDSAEAKLFLASGSEAIPVDIAPTKIAPRKAFRSAFEPLTDALPQRTDLNLGVMARQQAGKAAQATKLNTVEKSRMDWAGYVDKEGIKDDLELAGKSKESYTARQDFLARSEAFRDEEARRARIAGRAVN